MVVTASRASAEGSDLLEEPEQLLELLGVVASAEASNSPPPPVLATGAAANDDLEHKGDGSTSRAITTTRATRRRRPKDYKQTKLELEYLRARARELDSELQALQSGQGRSVSHSAVIATAWKRLVETQLRRRVQSEEENAQLRRELRMYAEITRALAQTLSTPPRGRFSLGELARPKQPRGLVMHDAAFFQDLVDDLNPAYARLDEVMRATGMDKVSTEMPRTLLPRRADAPPDVVEIGEVVVSPFDAWVWANSRWDTIAKMLTLRKPGQLGRMWRSDTVLAARIRIPGDERVWFRIVLKKFFDRVDHLVVVCRVQAECKSGAFAGYFFDETGWSLVKALHEQHPPGTIFRHCGQFQFRQRRRSGAAVSPGAEPLVEDLKVSVSSRAAGAFGEIMLRTFGEYMDDLIGQIDGLLLNDGRVNDDGNGGEESESQ